MIYYKVQAIRHEGEEPLREPRRRQCMELAAKAEEFWLRNNNENEKIFLSSISEDYINLGIIANNVIENYSLIDSFFITIGYEIDSYSCEEIRFIDLCELLRSGDVDNLIRDADAILDRTELSGLRSRSRASLVIGENLLDLLSPEQITERVHKYLVSQSFMPEYKRICSVIKKRIKGHPCHYLMTFKNKETRREVCRTLLSALYSRGRILARRYSYIDIDPSDTVSRESLDQLYKSSKDSAIIIRFNMGAADEGNIAVYDTEVISMVAEKIQQYRNSVQSLICFHPGDRAVRDVIVSKLSGINLVQIGDDKAGIRESEKYLRAVAKDAGVKADKKLFDKLCAQSAYDSDELMEIFNSWYTEKLHKQYPQYSSIPVLETLIDKKKGSTAYDEIQNMVGLDTAKKVIDNILDYYKGMNMFHSFGLSTDSPSRHIVLTGNPGTGKTSLARLLAGALHEAGIGSGAFVECGKGDLTGRYVGWTSKIVQEKFKAAESGILFIDECYSLFNKDHNDSFAIEAVNTIVQCMENYRDRVLVVFAGYPKPTEEFLASNPGLRSRIAFYINMDDYSTDELLSISEKVAEKGDMKLSNDAREKLRYIYDEARKDPEYGNGRFVRNCIEQAKMAHISRLIRAGKNAENITKDELVTIEAEDISTSVVHTAAKEVKKIGFAS